MLVLLCNLCCDFEGVRDQVRRLPTVERNYSETCYNVGMIMLSGSSKGLIVRLEL